MLVSYKFYENIHQKKTIHHHLKVRRETLSVLYKRICIPRVSVNTAHECVPPLLHEPSLRGKATNSRVFYINMKRF